MQASLRAFGLVVLTLVSLGLLGCGTRSIIPGEEEVETSDRIAWWREARFGLFIHWGLYTIPAGTWGDQTNHAEWIRTTAQIPLEEYDGLLAQFDPQGFDADEWVRYAKSAGMKYIVITSKHHDGFALFDSEHSDFDVMSTPFQRDIMKELADACRREGLKMCWYHSIMDWNHPDYLPRRGWEERSEEGVVFSRYVRFLHAQVEELLTKYGDIGVMWFDGEWEKTWTHQHGVELYELCRQLQPNVLVNNRVDKGRAGMAGLTMEGEYLGDFGTPEQEVPATGFPGVDWESCITMNRHWGFNAADQNWKSSRELIRMLVDIASKGGNLLLNVGPKANGTLPEPSIERLAAMGEWLEVNGEAIYGTSASPFAGLPWGRCTQRAIEGGTRLYLHVFDWPENGELRLAGLGNEVVGAHLLTTSPREVAVQRNPTSVQISLPAEPPNADCTVVALDIVGEPVVFESPEILAPSTVLVNELEVEIKTRSKGLEIRYTLDGTSPMQDSRLYAGPFRLSDSAIVRARSFYAGRPVSEVTDAAFKKVRPQPPGSFANLASGVEAALFEGDWERLPDFDALQSSSVAVVPGIALPAGPTRERYGMRFRGVFTVPRDEVYSFALASDDGSRLTVGGQVVIDNDGLHGLTGKIGVVALAKGTHEIVVEYFNRTGGAELDLRYDVVGGIDPIRIPPSLLSHVPSDAR